MFVPLTSKVGVVTLILWQEPSPRTQVEELQLPVIRPIISVLTAAVNWEVPFPLTIPVKVASPVPPLETANVPDQPSVRASPLRVPSTLVSFVTEFNPLDDVIVPEPEVVIEHPVPQIKVEVVLVPPGRVAQVAPAGVPLIVQTLVGPHSYKAKVSVVTETSPPEQVRGKVVLVTTVIFPVAVV